MKANRKQTAVKLTASKIGIRVMIRVVTKYDKQCLHQGGKRYKRPGLHRVVTVILSNLRQNVGSADELRTPNIKNHVITGSKSE